MVVTNTIDKYVDLPVEMIDKSIFEALEHLEPFLTEIASENNTALTESAVYSIKSGGKRLRPLLLFTIYRALGGSNFNEIIPLAASIEMVHTATLIHDDIIDNAPLRRGRPSVVEQFSMPYAIVTGDFLFVKAFELATTYKRGIMLMVAKACIDLAEGEVIESKYRYKENMNVNEYINIVTRKTASAIAAVSRSAAMVLDMSTEVTDAMERYGLNLGIAFQIKDDILDIYGTEEVIGKKRYTDLKTGNHTIMSLIAIQQLDSKDKEEFIKIFIKKNKDERDVDKLVDLIKKSGAEKIAMDIAHQYVDKVIRELSVIKDKKYMEILRLIAEKSIERSF
ncbi:MAG: polyprenyl synthetase family protein [Candidatus Thermoplasmatota archaeon]|jgi:heptaprenyl diphosphate synthase|nr:polyprenyl synthetase family protein [Candidatus Thermoplasmatota archaeon]MCL5962796.1 polyprenyl synthetase family protein [Candidatus Thermoplasmatota archaeon]